MAAELDLIRERLFRATIKNVERTSIGEGKILGSIDILAMLVRAGLITENDLPKARLLLNQYMQNTFDKALGKEPTSSHKTP